MNIAYAFVLPVIGLLLLIFGPAIHNKILKREHKERRINPSNTLTTYASEDILYRTIIQEDEKERRTANNTST